MAESTTYYSGLLRVDGVKEVIKVSVPGLVTEHRADPQPVRDALKRLVSEAKAQHPEASKIVADLSLGQGKAVSEEWMPDAGA